MVEAVICFFLFLFILFAFFYFGEMLVFQRLKCVLILNRKDDAIPVIFKYKKIALTI